MIAIDHAPDSTCCPFAAQPLTFAAVHDDKFSALPADARASLEQLLAALQNIHRAPRKWQCCQALARQLQGVRGWTASTLWKKYFRYTKGTLEFGAGDWRTVLDRVKAGGKWRRRRVITLPAATCEYFQQLVARNQRGKARSAWDKLISQWRAWLAGDDAARIPGYDVCPPPDPRTDAPAGWSYANLNRKRPSRFEQTVLCQGPKAAAEFRPLILTTRVGLDVGQFYLIDDCWHDFRVNVPGSRLASRLLQLQVLDLFSGCTPALDPRTPARGFKPALDNEVTGTQERLKEKEMLFLLTFLLCDIGYCAAGCTILAEAGTATVRPREQELFEKFSGGKIKVHVGPTQNRAAVAGFFTGKGGGNFRFKAALESYHNLLHNRTADLLDFPGQTGKDRGACPEENAPGAGRDQDNRALIEAMEILSVSQREKLILDFLPLNEAIAAVNRVCHFIDDRREHALEGWRDCGHITAEWRTNPHSLDYLPMSALVSMPSPERERVADYVRSLPNLTRERQLSPWEVFSAARPRLKRLAPFCAALLLADIPVNEPCRVANGMIEFCDADLSPEPLHYEARRRDGNGTDERLRDGEKYLVRVNPLHPGEAYLYGSKNECLGTVPRWDRARRDDPEALKHQFGRANKAMAELLGPARRLGAPITRARIAQAQKNAEVFGGNPEENSRLQDVAAAALGREC